MGSLLYRITTPVLGLWENRVIEIQAGEIIRLSDSLPSDGSTTVEWSGMQLIVAVKDIEGRFEPLE